MSKDAINEIIRFTLVIVIFILIGCWLERDKSPKFTISDFPSGKGIIAARITGGRMLYHKQWEQDGKMQHEVKDITDTLTTTQISLGQEIQTQDLPISVNYIIPERDYQADKSENDFYCLIVDNLNKYPRDENPYPRHWVSIEECRPISKYELSPQQNNFGVRSMLCLEQGRGKCMADLEQEALEKN